MDIIRHLSNEELVDLQIASDEQALGESVEQLRHAAQQWAARPEFFWHQQRAQIRERVSEAQSHSRGWIPLVWVMTLLLAGAGLALLNGGSAPSPVVQSRPAAVAADPDQQLLIAVQQTVEQGVPDSLEPATYLAEQIGQGTKQVSNSDRNKEATSEN